MRMRATSRSAAGSFERWYAVAIMRSTMPAISGRSDHTIARVAAGPVGNVDPRHGLRDRTISG